MRANMSNRDMAKVYGFAVMYAGHRARMSDDADKAVGGIGPGAGPGVRQRLTERAEKRAKEKARG